MLGHINVHIVRFLSKTTMTMMVAAIFERSNNKGVLLKKGENMFTENDSAAAAVAYNHYGCGGCTLAPLYNTYNVYIIYTYTQRYIYVYVSTCRLVIVIIIPWTSRAGGGACRKHSHNIQLYT